MVTWIQQSPPHWGWILMCTYTSICINNHLPPHPQSHCCPLLTHAIFLLGCHKVPSTLAMLVVAKGEDTAILGQDTGVGATHGNLTNWYPKQVHRNT